MENFNPPFTPGDQEQQQDYEDFMTEPVVGSESEVEVLSKPDMYIGAAELKRELLISYTTAAAGVIGLYIVGYERDLSGAALLLIAGGGAVTVARIPSIRKKMKDKNAESNN